MPKMLSQAEMKTRLAEVQALILKAEKEILPLQKERDDWVAKYEPVRLKMDKALKALNAKHGMFELKMELSALVKAMKK